MRIMGLDVGDRRIGIAMSDPMGWTAQPHSTLHRRNLAADIELLQKLCQEFEVELIVVGLPLNMNGTMGPKALEIQEFGDDLSKKLDLPIEYWDERLTTVSAEKVLLEANVSRQKRRGVIDKLAAVNILQNYLDRHAR